MFYFTESNENRKKQDEEGCKFIAILKVESGFDFWTIYWHNFKYMDIFISTFSGREKWI